MPRPTRDPWVAIDTTMRKNAKIALLPSDAARWGWIVVLSEAKLQRPSGYFRNQESFTEAVGRFSRFGQTYVDCGLLEVSPHLCPRCNARWSEAGAGYVVHDWHLHQRDPAAADRADSWRIEQRSNADRTLIERDRTAIEQRSNPIPPIARVETETETETPSTEGGRAGEPRPPTPRQIVIAWLKEHDYGEPSGWAVKPFNEMVRRRGAPAVIDIFEEGVKVGAPGANQLVRLAERGWDPPPKNGLHATDGATERRAEAEAAHDRQLAATQRLLSELRGERGAEA